MPLLGPYTVTKHAVVALARVLRLEAAASGVEVTAVCPAFVDTPLLDNIDPGSPPTGANTVGVALVRRVQGKPISPEQVATIVLAALPRNPEIIVAPRVLGRLGALAERAVPGVVRRVQRVRGRPLPAPASGSAPEVGSPAAAPRPPRGLPRTAAPAKTVCTCTTPAPTQRPRVGGVGQQRHRLVEAVQPDRRQQRQPHHHADHPGHHDQRPGDAVGERPARRRARRR